MWINITVVDQNYLHIILKYVIWPNKMEPVAKAYEACVGLTQNMKIQIK